MEKNKNYTDFQGINKRAYDAYYGEDVIKENTTTYLKKLQGMKSASDGQELYDIYLSNAVFYPATGRTVDAYSGMMFRKKPIIGGTNTKLTEQFTYDGMSIDQVAGEMARDTMLNSRCAILVDYPTVNTDGMSQAQIESFNIKPYAIFYKQDVILDWKYTVRNGLSELSQVTLFETLPSDKYNIDDPYTINGEIEARRVLTLENTADGDIYVNRLYAKTGANRAKPEYIMVSENVPIMNNRPLSYIPITPCSISGKWELDYPMINDLVLLNMADYRNEALYRDCLLFLGRPTPVISGLVRDDGQNEISLGSSTIIEVREGGSWGIIGGDAGASSALREEADRLKKQMATIGARSLMADSNVQEAFETASIKRAGESGVLSLVARAVNRALTTTLKIMAEWNGENSNDYYYRLNTDYVSSKIDVQTLQLLYAQYLAGEIPLSILYNAMDKNELLPEDMTEMKFMEDVKLEKSQRQISLQPIEPINEL